MTIPKHLRNLTDAQRDEIVLNWQYLKVGAECDLRRLPVNHGNRSWAKARLTECEERIAYFQAISTVESRQRSRQAQHEQAKRVMVRAHAIFEQCKSIISDVLFDGCLRAAWTEEKTGVAFKAPVKKTLTQIFITFYKSHKSVSLRSKLLPYSLTINPKVFEAWKQRGVISVQQNEYVETARIETESFEVFEAECLEWEKGVLADAKLRAQIVVTEQALQECKQQHRPCRDLEVKLQGLRAALTA